MAGNRLFFPVQAVMFYSGTEWDALETEAKRLGRLAGTEPVYDPAENDVTPVMRMAHGVQDVSMTSNFTLTPVFELGQAEMYENTEGIPTVEITLSKVLDGRALLWHLATIDAVTPELIARTNAYSTFQLGLWPDSVSQCFWDGDNTVDDATLGIANPDAMSVMPIGVITCPKTYPSSLGYTVNTTDASTENITLSGNEKIWARARTFTQFDKETLPILGDTRFQTAQAQFTGEDRPLERIAQGYNVMVKPLIAQYGAVEAALDDLTQSPNNAAFITALADAMDALPRDRNGALKDRDCSVFPIEIPGINAVGVNDITRWVDVKEGVYQPNPNFARVQSVSFSVTLTRNDINSLGYRLPIHKSAQLPIQVATEITVVSTTDDGIAVAAFSSACQNVSGLRPQTIRLALCNGEPPTPAWPLGPDEADMEGDINGVRFYSGTQNKLTSVAFGQGGTGGGNVQATYSYQSNNTFTVVAKSDPSWRNGTELVYVAADGSTTTADATGAQAPIGQKYVATSTVTPPGGGGIPQLGWWSNRELWVGAGDRA